MLKALFLTLAIVLSINYSMPTYAADKECSITTKTEFLDVLANRIQRVHWIDVTTRTKYVDNMNKHRSNKGLWIFTDVQKMVVGELKDGAIGVALFDSNDCLIPGSAVVGVGDIPRGHFKTFGVENIMDIIGTGT